MTISKWTAAGMPVAERGGRGRESRYDLKDVVAWRVQTLVQQARESGVGPAGPAPPDLAAARTRLTQAMTARTLMEVGQRRRELLPASEVQQVFGACVASIRTGVLSIPRAAAERCVAAVLEFPGVAAALEPRKTEAMAAVEVGLKAVCFDVLRALAAWPGGLFGTDAPEEGVKPS